MKYYLWLIGISITIFCNCTTIEPKLVSSDLVHKLWIRESFVKDYTRPRILQSLKPVVSSTRGIVIHGDKQNGITAYTEEKGEKKWQFLIKGGLAGGVLLSGDQIFFHGADGFMYALKLQTGKLLWKQHTGATSSSTPVIKNNRVYFSKLDKLYCLNSKTGSLIWTYSVQLKVMQFTIEGVATPLVEQSLIYFKTGDGWIIAVNHKGKFQWKVQLFQQGDRFTSALSSPVLGPVCLYVAGFDTHLYCLNPKTGKLIWKTGKGSHSQIVLSGAHLFYSTSDGYIRALEQKSGKLIWSHKVAKSIATAPVVYKDKIIYGEYSGPLRFLSKKTGKLAGSFFFGKGISATPELVSKNSELYLISNYGWLYKLKLLF